MVTPVQREIRELQKSQVNYASSDGRGAPSMSVARDVKAARARAVPGAAAGAMHAAGSQDVLWGATGKWTGEVA